MNSEISITPEGWAVVRDDTHGSRWVERSGRIDCGWDLERKMRAHFGPGDVVLDIGACIGHHTVPYAHIVGPSGHVFSFEPFPLTYECLMHNTRGLSQVSTHNCALGDVEAELPMHREANLGAAYLDPGGSGPRVPVRALDSFMYGIPRVKFVKIDTEGWELFVLRGGQRLFMRDRPTIMWEVQANGARKAPYARREVFDLLRSWGYEVEPDRPEFEQYDSVAVYRGR